jgi:hypothetical protein
MTTIIDRMLMKADYGKVSNHIILPNGHSIPGVGNHLYYLNGKQTPFLKRISIRLQKIIKKENERDYYVYRARYFYTATYYKIMIFCNLIKQTQNSLDQVSVGVISIDTSSDPIKLLNKTIFYSSPSENQIKARNFIMEHWMESNKKNTKVLISGPMGVGKTYVGPVIKKYIDVNQNPKNVQLYNDFNPRSIGVNIDVLALTNASNLSPVILVINEIDTIYEYVVSEHQSFDPRLQHARNKSDFHNMLDSINSTMDVICIFTTEKTPEELYANENFRSFLRVGRVDFFIEMNQIQCTKKLNQWNNN